MKRFLILAILFVAIIIKAQPPTKFYTKFGGQGIDIGYGVKTTLDRQYIVVGSTSSYGAGNTDVYFVKVDSMGVPVWGKTFGGAGNDVGRSVIQLPDSGYVLSGFTNSFGAGGYDAYFVRTDKNGALIWQKTFGGTDWDFGYDLIYSADGNIVICGTTVSYGHGNMDGFVCKFDLSGNLVWQKFYGGAEDDELKAIINTNDGNIGIVGYTKSNGDINGDCLFYKLDVMGDTIFTRVCGGVGIDYATDVIQKQSGEYIIAGAKTLPGDAYTSSAYFNYSSSGSFNWEGNTNYANANENINALTDSQAGDKTCYLRSVPKAAFKLQGSIFIAKNSSISAYMSNEFGGTEDEIMYGIDKTADGGYVSIGTTNSFNSINGDVYLIKQDSTIIGYTSIVGLSTNKKNGNDGLIYTKNKNLLIILNYPQHTFAILEIYDLNGTMLLKKEITSTTTIINLEAFSSGLYTTRLLSNDNIFTKKIVVGKD